MISVDDAIALIKKEENLSDEYCDKYFHADDEYCVLGDFYIFTNGRCDPFAEYAVNMHTGKVYSFDDISLVLPIKDDLNYDSIREKWKVCKKVNNLERKGA